MIDAHEFAGCPAAFKALDAALDSVQPHLPSHALSRDEQYARPHKDESWCWDEPYTLPENQFLAWQRGAGSRYRDLGERFLADDWYWNPLSNGENVLPGKHAYSHVNAMSSAMQAYFVLGSQKHLQAARNGFDFVRAQSFAMRRRASLPAGGGRARVSASPAAARSAKASPIRTQASRHPAALRALQNHALPAAHDARQPLRRQHGARALQHHSRSKPIQKDGHGFYYSTTTTTD